LNYIAVKIKLKINQYEFIIVLMAFFSVEYVAYFLDRNMRLQNLRSQLQVMLKTNAEYTEQQKEVQTKYDTLETDRQTLVADNEQLLNSIRSLRQAILSVCPSKKLPPDPSTLLAQPQVVLSPVRKDAKKQKTQKARPGKYFKFLKASAFL